MESAAFRRAVGLAIALGWQALGCCAGAPPPGDAGGEEGPQACRTNADCDDGRYCNGPEWCSQGVCQAGLTIACDDGIACTFDRCDEAARTCRYTLRDGDGDGHADEACALCDPSGACTTGDDCDDSNPNVHPGAGESCTNGIDDDCNGWIDSADPACPPTNDACASAVVLPGPGTYFGATRGAALDYAYPCAAAGSVAHDVVFALEVGAPADVHVSVESPGSTFVVALESTCGDPSTLLRCQTDSQLSARGLAAGTYYILVASTAETGFDLTVDFYPPTPPLPDTCALALDVGGGGSFSGMFSGASDDYTASCGASGLVDLVYSFTLSVISDVDVTASRPELLDPFTVVSVETICGDPATEIGCGSNWDPTRVLLEAFAPGTYFILVQGSPGDAYTLTVTIVPSSARVAGDTCGTAIPLSGSGSYTAAFSGTWDDYPLSCDAAYMLPGDLVDVVFAIPLGATSDVVVDAPPGPWAMTLESTCGNSGTDIGCQESTGTSLRSARRALAPGTYYLLIEEYRATGLFDAPFTVTIEPAGSTIPGDVCGNPIELPGTGTYSGSLVGAWDDYTTSCGGFGTAFDLVYHLHAAVSSDLWFLPTTSGFGAGVDGAFQSACGTGPDLGCALSSPQVPILEHNIAAGDYFFLVEGTRAIPFSLDYATWPTATLESPTGNDACPGAWPVGASGGYFAGNTSAMTNDYTGGCAPGGASPDAVFRLDLPASSRVLASLAGTSFPAVLYVRQGDCAGPEVGCAYGGFSAAPWLDLTLAAGTYFVVVDGSGGSGPYRLDVAVNP